MSVTPLKILLVGNCILDQVYTLPRFPQEDDEIRALSETRALGGNACNSAQVLRQLGHEVYLMSSLAGDMTAEWIRQQLAGLKINTDLCQTFPDSATPVSSIWLNEQNGSRTIVHHRDLLELQLPQMQQLHPEDYDWIHFEGRNIQALTQFLPSLQHSGVSVSLEIEKRRTGIEQLIPFVDTVIISSHYLRQRKLSAIEAIEELKSLNSACQLVCTLGPSGVLAKNSSDEIIRLKAEPLAQQVDTLGAGDCFIAGLVSHLCQQQSFETALQFANTLAAQKIQHKGLKLEALPA